MTGGGGDPGSVLGLCGSGDLNNELVFISGP